MWEEKLRPSLQQAASRGPASTGSTMMKRMETRPSPDPGFTCTLHRTARVCNVCFRAANDPSVLNNHGLLTTYCGLKPI